MWSNSWELHVGEVEDARSTLSRELELSWQDIVKAILWGFLFLLLILSSFVSLHLKFHKLSAVCIFLGILLPTCLWISRQRQLAKKRERRMLLPLSM
ncbi:hypothetical protein IEQ34_013370 [Dendrobium chrysotoxum]|uniref:Uncharacterized protein n=1 Tax=Dendrobium chrysotoxum TaxID=161865 RepID=A0AAV7G871_DENCH|nr:hypothetical protein IEQ34_013370 [Dendrobium chrysotoxum]